MYWDPAAKSDLPAWPGTAPAGVTPDLNAPPSTAGRVMAVNVITTGLMVLFVLLRLYSRVFVSKAVIGWEDYSCTLAGLVSLIHIVGTSAMTYHGMGNHIWEISQVEASKMLFWSWFANLYYVGLFFAKLAIMLLYLRVFQYKNTFKYLVWIIVSAVFVQCFLGFVLNMFQCAEHPSAAWMPWSYPDTVCFDTIKINTPIAISNLITDVMIYVLPISVVTKLQMSMEQKFGVIFIFLLGAVGSIFSVLRLWAFLIWDWDADWTFRFESQSMWLWCICELNAFIICACLPVLKQLVHRVFDSSTGYFRNLSSLSFSRKSSRDSPTSSNAQTSGHRFHGSVSSSVPSHKQGGSFSSSSSSGPPSFTFATHDYRGAFPPEDVEKGNVNAAEKPWPLTTEDDGREKDASRTADPARRVTVDRPVLQPLAAVWARTTSDAMGVQRGSMVFPQGDEWERIP